ncbi:MAG: type II secretion system F family protein [Candidatus Berkelbacteria bacterium]|nr:type II secretion system F family protein [Candidatus Berkelbacteria bacterium]
MPTFIYQAKNSKGQVVSGTVDAESERVATQALWENKLKVISLSPKPIIPAFNFLRRVSISEKAIFARQLATMVSAGVHLPKALNVCLNQSRSKRMQEVLAQAIQDVEGGYSLSSAIAKHPDVFDHVFVSIIKAGESSGKLEQVLVSLADRIEKDASFRSKVRGALVYPIFVFCVLIVIGALMMLKVIPQIKGIFEESNVQLPLITRILLGLSDFLVHYWWIVIVGIVVLAVLVRMFLRTERGQTLWNTIIISTPGIGGLNKAIIMSRFARTFGLLVKTGIPILEALNSVADVMDNEIYKKAVLKIALDVERGIPLSVPLSKDPRFPPIVSQMASVGEQSGALDQIMDRLGIFYENIVDEKTKIIGSIIEPVVIVLLGVAVGMLVFGVLMPIYQIAQVQ